LGLTNHFFFYNCKPKDLSRGGWIIKDNVFQISTTLTFIESHNRIYNWLNGEYVEFEDISHPFLHLVKNKSENFNKFKYDNSFDDFNWLIDNKFIVSNHKEVQDIILNRAKELDSSQNLHLTLLPAQMACNFNCPYCYEDKKQKSRMGQNEKEIILNYINKRADLKNLQIEWFGGEPLLGKDFILDFSQAVYNLAKFKNIDYRSSMTTNGFYLTSELFQKLVNLNVKAFQITIDGLEENHNKLRPLSNGEPTFKTIIHNLTEISKLKSLDFNIVLRTNFNENSDINGYIEFMKNLDLSKDKRFAFIFRPIESDLNDLQNDVSCSKVESSSLQKSYEDKAINNALEKGDLFLYKDIGSHSCPASRENALILYPDMTVRKCTVALDNPKNMVGIIQSDGNLVKNENWDLWTLNTNSIYNKPDCLTCSFNPQCLSSACPLEFIDNMNIACPSESSNLENLSNSIIDFIES